MRAYLQDRQAEGQDITRAALQLEAHVLPRWGERTLRTLAAAELRAWRDELAATPPRLRRPKRGRAIRFAATDMSDPDVRRKRRSTVNRITTLFKAALNHAARLHSDASGNPATWREGLRAFRNVETPRERWLEREDVLRLIAACDANFRRLVLAALYTGCRYGELCRAKVGDYHARSQTLRIPVSKSGYWRDVVLHDEAVAFFSDLVRGRGTDELLLTRTVRGGAARRAWGRGHQIRPMARACRRAGIRPPISFHGLRHTYTSLAVQSGMALLALSRNLGHADTRMVEKHYGHLSDRYLREQVKRHVPALGVGRTEGED